MTLDSYLEIFTTMYGWAFANIIGEIIVGTGLIVIPFAVILFQSWREAKEQGLQSAGVLPLLERSMTRLVIAIFVMSVCFATTPISSLNHVGLSHTPMATINNPTPAEGSLTGGTGSGFDDGMRDAADGSMSATGNLARVPLWWYTVMAISSGFNNAIRDGLKNSDHDMRVVEDMARNATIEDPQLKHNMNRFYSECFLPARSAYLDAMKHDGPSGLTPAGQATVDAANADYGPTDVDWIGSKLFREEPGFYADMRSKQPVPGFAVDFSRDTDYYNPSSSEPPHPGQVNPDWGRPTCKEWWEDSQNGLRAQTIGHSSTWTKLLDKAGHVFSWRNDEQKKDAFARLTQSKANPTLTNDNSAAGDYGALATLSHVVGGAVSTVGVGFGALATNVVFTPLITALPMMQAIILMAIYMFLPLAVFLSGFSLRAMFYGAVAIFTVKLWAAMWFMSQWIDARLYSSMYPGLKGNFIVQEITQAASGSTPQAYKRMLLNIMLMTMFIGLPLVWTAMMGWIGISVGSELAGLAQKTEGGAKQIGNSSMAAGNKAVTATASRVSKNRGW